MRFGAFLMPSHPPERGIRDGQLWDLQDLERLDALGFEEAWIGEHFTAAWEPCPAPDLLIAQALSKTEADPPRPAGAPGFLSAPPGGRSPVCVTETSYQLSALPTVCLGPTGPALPSRHEIRT